MFCNRLKLGEKEIFLLGSIHSNKSKYVAKVKNAFLYFNPDVVLVEGCFNVPDYLNEKDAIISGGDMGLINFLSKSSDIPIFSNDPSLHEDIAFLEKISGRDKTFLYFFLRELTSKKHSELLEIIKKNTNWGGYDFSIEKVSELFLRYFSVDFDVRKDYSEYFNPTLDLCFLNELTKKLNIHRDNFMINETRRLLEKFNRIFIIKGEYHLRSNLNKFKTILK